MQKTGLVITETLSNLNNPFLSVQVFNRTVLNEVTVSKKKRLLIETRCIYHLQGETGNWGWEIKWSRYQLLLGSLSDMGCQQKRGDGSSLSLLDSPAIFHVVIRDTQSSIRFSSQILLIGPVPWIKPSTSGYGVTLQVAEAFVSNCLLKLVIIRNKTKIKSESYGIACVERMKNERQKTRTNKQKQ